MKQKILAIKKMIKDECSDSAVGSWFYDTHLIAVENFAKKLLKRLPKANKEIVMLSIWLHDLQRIRGIKGDHSKVGAHEAEKMMKKFNYDNNIIRQVKEAILTHQCKGKIRPKSLEGKILSSADAMSHYANDFYLRILLSGSRSLEEAKKWALEKLDRDYNSKIQFDFARDMIKKQHNALKIIFTMK